ncbi:uncharacterized protein LOC107370824 [Tetranychus urticae]|uniref:uncharacterized protein LOC107370824 n=1 Tax=Tetranychus urticae TaxID=32264 RepID=UPI000D648133|nr:uncharacterized protein LOC107370824 [Tetranychus urticae]
MDTLKNDDKLTVINRSSQYLISKKLILKVPYFEKMLSHDSLESTESKVELDFDEKALKLILHRIEHGYIFIEMDCVINLCTIADYFGMDNHLINECLTHFHDNFSIEHLPVIIPQVTSTSKLINSGTLNAFICRYFTKIVNTSVWLDYPIETIEYICALDLMIYSEVKVFDSIMKWVKSKPDSRKSYLKNLLKSIRWCHLEDKDLAKIKENIYVKSSDFDPKLCCRDKSGCNCSTDRTKQKYFIAIEKLDATNLRVKVLDKNFFLLVNQAIQSDESMPLKLIHDEHVSDVFFDSGRKMIRIDWKQKKYRLLEAATFQSHFTKCLMLISDEQKSEEHYAVKINNPLNSEQASESSLLEADDKFILVRFYGKQFKYWAMPTDENIRSHFWLKGRSCLGTVLDNNIYMLTDRLELIQFKIDRKCEFERIEFEKYREKFYSDSLLLTSNLTNDKVIIIEKSTKELFCYNVKTEKWSSMGRISNCDSGSDGKTKSHDLIAFTSTFLSMDAIKACLNMNSNE